MQRKRPRVDDAAPVVQTPEACLGDKNDGVRFAAAERVPANVELKLIARTDDDQPCDLVERFGEDAIRGWINNAVKTVSGGVFCYDKVSGFAQFWISHT